MSVQGDLRRRCPKCEAAPGWRCGRYVGAIWTALKNTHAERRAPVAVKVSELADATMTRAGRELRKRVLDPMAHEEFRSMLSQVERDIRAGFRAGRGGC